MQGRLEIQEHVRSMTDDDGAVLLDLKAGKYYSLNTLGAQIWNQAEKGLSLPEILNYLEDQYSLPPRKLEDDLCSFVEGLKEKELIRVNA